ncbi:hypothetical protein SLEP1_g1424 [Rubroshorea leprosula]|uniref:Uncharacterized protein n=1 Tax=Rubroshorea leprosula TaxID=152421 RepID=A0AAV5HDS1_9ROSI|nr:hypothetical protein SLEP1_g1424 [Rubroshorea leprosula]
MEEKLSSVAKNFTPSPIQELSHLAQRCNAINLAEGFPDFPAPLRIKNAALLAVEYNPSYHPRLTFLPHFWFSSAAGRSGFFSGEACCRCSSVAPPVVRSAPVPVSSPFSRSID